MLSIFILKFPTFSHHLPNASFWHTLQVTDLLSRQCSKLTSSTPGIPIHCPIYVSLLISSESYSLWLVIVDCRQHQLPASCILKFFSHTWELPLQMSNSAAEDNWWQSWVVAAKWSRNCEVPSVVFSCLSLSQVSSVSRDFVPDP